MYYTKGSMYLTCKMKIISNYKHLFDWSNPYTLFWNQYLQLIIIKVLK